jgi:hypothetical protein
MRKSIGNRKIIGSERVNIYSWPFPALVAHIEAMNMLRYHRGEAQIVMWVLYSSYTEASY